MAQPLAHELETVERVLNLIGGLVTISVRPDERFLSGQTFTIMLNDAGGYGLGQGGTFAGALQDLHAVNSPAIPDAVR